MDNQLSDKKVLLVEDELFIRDLYQRVLEKAGYQVIVAQDGQEALEKISQKPNLILLDIMLPKINGLEVLKELAKLDPQLKIPVLLLTNLGQESVILEALKNGARGYLMKIRHDPYEIVSYVQKFIEDPDYKMDISQMDLD